MPGKSHGQRSLVGYSPWGQKELDMTERLHSRPLPGGGWNDGFDPLDFSEASLVAHTVRNLHAMRETWVQSLSQEDPLQKEMTTHSTIPAWRIPWTEEPDGYSPWGCKESDTTE